MNRLSVISAVGEYHMLIPDHDAIVFIIAADSTRNVPLHLLPLRLLRDDIDDAAHCLRTVENRSRPLHDFDFLNGIHGNRVQHRIIVQKIRRSPVNEQKGSSVKSSDTETREHAAVLLAAMSIGA